MNVRRSTLLRATASLAGAWLLLACGSQVPPDVYLSAQANLGVATDVPTAAGSNPPPSAAGGPGAASLSLGSGATGSGANLPGGGPLPGRGAQHGVGATSSATSHMGGRHPGSNGGSQSPHPTSSASRSTSSGQPPRCAPPTATTPTVVVCPSSGLHDGQTVHVYASGFQNAKRSGLMPAALVVTECADKGNDTQQADCGALHFVNPDSNGKVSITITVTKVVGSNKNVCGQTYRCLVSVAQPKQPPDYEADQHISFE